MKKNTATIAIYSRKSKFTGKGESIGNQIELCKEYVSMHYGEKCLDNIQIFEDEGFSGGNLNRPAFKRMMESAHEHKIDTIVVYRLDRISRNISDFSSLIEELSHLNIAFVSIREQFDTSSPMGRAMMFIASVFSQLERETIAERIRDNMHELAKTGRWLGGITPTGYASESVKSVTVDGKTKKACKLRLIPEEAEAVRQIFALFLKTESLTMTEAELMKQGVTSKNGKLYSRFAIKGILRNPVYVIADEDSRRYLERNEAEIFAETASFDGIHGIMAYNRTDQEKGRTTIYNPISDWIVAIGEHQGMISGKDWTKAQDLLDQNKSKAFRRPRSNESLLTGILYCSCGHKMYPKLSNRTNADGELVFRYVCKLKERSKKSLCNSPNLHGNQLDKAIVEEIKKLTEDDSVFMAQMEKSCHFYTGDRTEYDQQLIAAREEQAEVQRKITALVDTLTTLGDSLACAHIAKRIEELHVEDAALESKIRELEGLTSQHVMDDLEFDALRQILSSFPSTLDEMPPAQKRVAIRTLVRRVIWDGERAHLILFGVEDDDIEYPAFTSHTSDDLSNSDENDDYNGESTENCEENDGEKQLHWREDSK